MKYELSSAEWIRWIKEPSWQTIHISTPYLSATYLSIWTCKTTNIPYFPILSIDQRIYIARNECGRESESKTQVVMLKWYDMICCGNDLVLTIYAYIHRNGKIDTYLPTYLPICLRRPNEMYNIPILTQKGERPTISKRGISLGTTQVKGDIYIEWIIAAVVVLVTALKTWFSITVDFLPVFLDDQQIDW